MLRSSLAILSILAIIGCASSSGPINKAALRGDAEAIAPLVEKGEDINKVGAHGMTPLINATYYGFAPTVRELLRLGADPDIQDDQKWTALHYASSGGRPDMVKMLLDAGADPNIEDLYGKTATTYAEEYDQRGKGDGFFMKALFQIGRE
jgi:ankyrin repeat protein